MIALLLNLLLFGLLCWGFYRRWNASPITIFYWPGLLLKVIAGWGVVGLYRYYYGYGDLFTYHKKAATLANLFWRQSAEYFYELGQIGFLSGVGGYHGYDRVEFFIRMISPVYIVADGNLWIAAAWLSLFSFLGLFWLARRLSSYFIGSELAAAAAFLFLPSVLFWTGSITKEALMMPSIAILVAVVLPNMLGTGRSSLLQWLLALLAAWIVWRLKYYFALPLFTILIALLLARLAKKQLATHLPMLLLAGTTLLLTGFLLSQLHPNLHPDRVLGVLTHNYWASVLETGWDKQLHFPNLKPTLWSLLFYSPKALAGGLLMPLPFVPPRFDVLQLLAGVENFFVLLLLIGSFYKLYRLPKTTIPLPALGLALYVCFLAVAMAIASPNFGTLLRYRTAYLPFAVFLLLYWLFPTVWFRREE